MKPTAHNFSREVSRMLTKYSILPITLAFISAVLVLCVLYYLSLKYSVVERRDEAAQRLEESVQSYKGYTGQISGDETLLRLLNGEGGNKSAAETLYGFINSQTVRADFYILNSSGECVLGSTTILSDYLEIKPPFYSGMLYRMSNDPDEVVLMLNNAGTARRKSMVLSVGTAIVDGEDTVGFIVFELDPEETLDYIAGQGVGELVVTDSYGTVLLTSKNSYQDNYNKLDSTLSSGEKLISRLGSKLFVTHCPVGDLGLELYIVAEIGSIYQALAMTSALTLFLLLVMLMANFLLIRRMAAVETRSVDQLIADLHKMQQEGIYVPITTKEYGGFASLEETYAKLIEDIRKLVEMNKQEAVMRTTAEIRQLESQFNPHFIFNTLEVIRCLIKLDPAGANKMILDFSDLLRYSIDGSRQMVQLRDDLTYVKSYLSIVRLRKSISLDYEIDIEEGALDCVVPKLSLQPIVENAVKYAGVGRGGLKIKMDIRRLAGDLVMSIEDDGVGIQPELLAEIRNAMNQSQTPDRFFGLYNVHRRIRLMYGADYGLEIQSRPGEGTKVTVRLPFRQEGAA